MTHRPCLNCGTLTPHTRCTTCQRHHDQHRRPTTNQRGYDTQHQALRAQLTPTVHTGHTNCWRCQEPIHPNTPWHLGHDDTDRTQYRGPEHAKCNITAANQHRRSKQQR